MKLLLTILALIYAAFPRDLLPDYLPGWGWIDDLVILYLLWKFYYAPTAKRRKGFQQEARRPYSEGNSNEDSPEATPYSVLGVGPEATPEQIRQAYRILAAQYHPDKVAHLGEEFRALAEKRFKEIQEAYEKIKPHNP